ncbi:tetrahydrofolate dehydrogenase/cyclohydrolase, partial [Baffinella frigidus]
VIVGGRKDSEAYVSHKVKACDEVGIESRTVKLAEDATEAQVIEDVKALCQDESVDAVIVQLPLPKHIAEFAVLDAIPFEKDVDGFHPMNLGNKEAGGQVVGTLQSQYMTFGSTMSTFERDGHFSQVVGRSNIVGTPVALLLLQAHATVQVVHTRTDPLALHRAISEADILVACAGVPNLIKGEWIKEGAVVIDVGINAVPDATKKAGHRLVGDIEYAAAAERASKITPVPGGVGPMTV